MARTLEPIVVNEPREQVTPTLFKGDVEKIIKEYLAAHPEVIGNIAKESCYSRFDINNPPTDLVGASYTTTDIDEAIEKGVFPKNGTYSDLSDEQIQSIKKLIVKATKDGVIRDGASYLFLNYAWNDVDTLRIGACYGDNADHVELGEHIEILLDETNKQFIIHYTEV